VRLQEPTARQCLVRARGTAALPTLLGQRARPLHGERRLRLTLARLPVPRRAQARRNRSPLSPRRRPRPAHPNLRVEE
jgi:hypothetical protein